MDLDIELRRRAEIQAFIQFLKFFADLKKQDEETYNKIKEEEPNKDINQIVAKNYISISKIHTVSLKISPEVVELLRDLCPKMFEMPINYSPLMVEEDFKEYENQ